MLRAIYREIEPAATSHSADKKHEQDHVRPPDSDKAHLLKGREIAEGSLAVRFLVSVAVLVFLPF